MGFLGVGGWEEKCNSDEKHMLCMKKIPGCYYIFNPTLPPNSAHKGSSPTTHSSGIFFQVKNSLESTWTNGWMPYTTGYKQMHSSLQAIPCPTTCYGHHRRSNSLTACLGEGWGKREKNCTSNPMKEGKGQSNQEGGLIHRLGFGIRKGGRTAPGFVQSRPHSFERPNSSFGAQSFY